jgi:hypothetical protein
VQLPGISETNRLRLSTLGSSAEHIVQTTDGETKGLQQGGRERRYMALLLLPGLWSADLFMRSLPTADLLAFDELPRRAIRFTSQESNQVSLAMSLADGSKRCAAPESGRASLGVRS